MVPSFGNRVHDIEVADHVVDLGVDGVLAVDHGVRGRTLLAEVHHCFGLEVADDPVGEGGVGQVAHPDADIAPGELLPLRHPVLYGCDRNEAVDTHFLVVLTTDQIVDDGDVVPASRKVQGRRPAQIPVTAQNQNPHCSPSSLLNRSGKCCISVSTSWATKLETSCVEDSDSMS